MYDNQSLPGCDGKKSVAELVYYLKHSEINSIELNEIARFMQKTPHYAEKIIEKRAEFIRESLDTFRLATDEEKIKKYDGVDMFNKVGISGPEEVKSIEMTDEFNTMISKNSKLLKSLSK